MELINYTANELIKLIDKKQVKVKEVNKAFLERIQEVEKNIGAFLNFDLERILDESNTLDILLEKKINLGQLRGIPIGIKDNINVKGMKTTCASKILNNYISPYNATIIEKLKAQWGIIMGKTNMDEFAMGSSCENSSIKVTKNPLNLSRVPGGSSGGSAASVCAREVPIALGTDTGGSVRQPASFCGIVGFKPTYGTISRYGVVSFASTLDTIGIFSRDVKDSVLMYEVLKGYDKKDSTTVKLNLEIKYRECFNKDLKGLKIAVPTEFLNEKLDKNIRKNIENSIEVLKKNGAKIKEVSIPLLNYVLQMYYILSSAEVSSNLGRFDGIRYGYRTEKFQSIDELYIKTRTEGFNNEVKKRILLGTFVLSKGYYDEYYNRALKARIKLSKEFKNIFKDYDAIIGPTSPNVAFKLGENKKGLDMYLQDLYTVPANLTGIPAISIPCGEAYNLPVGLQIMTNHFKEDTLFKIAYSLEQSIKNKFKFQSIV